MPRSRSQAGETGRRSGCPVSVSLDIFGDRWSLLIVRDMMVRGYATFHQFARSGEGIASNILAARLKRLEDAAIIRGTPDPKDGRRLNYRLTEKGIDLAPVLLELFIWAARHEKTVASSSCTVMEQMQQQRERVLAEVRRRWREQDSTPFIPGPEVANVRRRRRARIQKQKQTNINPKRQRSRAR